MSTYQDAYAKVFKLAGLRAQEEPEKAQELQTEMQLRFAPNAPRSPEEVSTPKTMMRSGLGGALLGALSGGAIGGFGFKRPFVGAIGGTLAGAGGGALMGIDRADAMRAIASSHPHEEYEDMSTEEFGDLYNAYFDPNYQ